MVRDEDDEPLMYSERVWVKNLQLKKSKILGSCVEGEDEDAASVLPSASSGRYQRDTST